MEEEYQHEDHGRDGGEDEGFLRDVQEAREGLRLQGLREEEVTTPYDLDGSEKEIQQKIVEREQKRSLNDLKSILDTPFGRRFVWKLLSDCGVFRSSMTGNAQTYYLEGRRSVGLEVLQSVMSKCPDKFTQMQAEYVSEQIQRVKGEDDGR